MDAKLLPQTEGGTADEVMALRRRARLDRAKFGALIGSSPAQVKAWEYSGLRSQHAWELLQIRALWSVQDYLGAAKAILGTGWMRTEHLAARAYAHTGWRLGRSQSPKNKNALR